MVHSKGKVSLKEYANLMEKAYIGISLMVSPHPSYPPLEMASFGMKVITNNYDNKNMNVYDNIVAIDNCEPFNLSNVLIELCKSYSDQVEINIDKKYVDSDSIDSVCSQIILK